jgi:hypothetical protein
MNISFMQWPFHNITSHHEIQKRVLHSERPSVDSRYFTDNNTVIERNMIEIMNSMWDQNPQNRPTIFEAITRLTKIRAMVGSSR